MAKTSRRKKTSRRTTRRSRPRRAVRHSRPRKGIVVYKSRLGKKWKVGQLNLAHGGLGIVVTHGVLRAWRKMHKGARVLGHAVGYRAQQKLLKRMLRKSATRRVRRRSRR